MCKSHLLILFSIADKNNAVEKPLRSNVDWFVRRVNSTDMDENVNTLSLRFSLRIEKSFPMALFMDFTPTSKTRSQLSKLEAITHVDKETSSSLGLGKTEDVSQANRRFSADHDDI